MKLLVPVAAACAAACGSAPSATTPQILELERWSPPQASAHDVLLAARGDVIVMQRRISRDGGQTWSPLDGRIGELRGVAITGQTMTLYGTQMKLARWDLGSDALTPVGNAPSFAHERTWRVDPGGNLIAFDAVENAIALERAGSWTTSKLPQPTATEVRPYIKDVESNGSVVLAVSAWGVHRSTDGTTWTHVSPAGNARDLLVLGDRRFALVGDGPARLFDASGAALGTHAGLDLKENEATVCEDGSIVARNRVTRDLGATWETLVPGGELDLVVQRTGCGAGRYWALALSEVWGYRFVRYEALGAPGVAAGNWDSLGDQAWSSSAPPIVHASDGTFLTAGLALAPGASEWTLRVTPARTWASGDVLFGVQQKKFFTSLDGGTTWIAAPAHGLDAEEPEAFARTPDGALYVSQFTGANMLGVDTWRSVVWKSLDDGASWSIAYEGIATRTEDDVTTGQAHRFVGIAPDGAWIATDAVSRDGGATWHKTTVLGDRGLAHLTRAGTLVTGGADEDLWRIYDDGGLGELRATYQIEVDGRPIPASQLRSVAFDDEGYAYVARGTPYIQIWRSNRPIE
jgi:hypothetical protein